MQDNILCSVNNKKKMKIHDFYVDTLKIRIVTPQVLYLHSFFRKINKYNLLIFLDNF